MRPEKKTKTNIGVGIGFILQLAGFFLPQTWDPPAILGLALTGDTAAILGLVLIFVSIPVFIWGCINYAEGKGHSKWVGLVGLAGIIGLIVLILLSDRDLHGSVARLQLRKFVWLISMVAGLGFTVLGRWLDHLGDDVRLERLLHPWPAVCMVLGICLVVGSLVFMLAIRRR